MLLLLEGRLLHGKLHLRLLLEGEGLLLLLIIPPVLLLLLIVIVILGRKRCLAAVFVVGAVEELETEIIVIELFYEGFGLLPDFPHLLQDPTWTVFPVCASAFIAIKRCIVEVVLEDNLLLLRNVVQPRTIVDDVAGFLTVVALCLEGREVVVRERLVADHAVLFVIVRKLTQDA